MPLYVTNGKLQLGEPGQLAAQRACCCNEEGDNPEDCVCPDFCLYQSQVVEPTATQRAPTIPCTPLSISAVTEPYSPPSCAFADPLINIGGQTQSVSGFGGVASIGAQVYRQYRANIDIGPAFYPPFYNLSISASASVVCNSETKKNLLVIEYFDLAQIAANTFGFGSELPTPEGCDAQLIFARKYAEFEISHTCRRAANASCELQDSSKIAAIYPSVPITISVDKDGTSLGAWQSTSTTTEGDTSCIEDCYSKFTEDFSATFRITQRSSCRIVDCDCSTDVCGLVADVRAYPGGPLVEWILCKPEEEQSRDREFSCTIEGVSYTCLYKYREQTETKNGVSVSIHRFIYERFANPPDVSGFPRERKVADLWCDGDGWMMDFQTVCYRVDLDTGFGGGYEEDRAVGEILCGPACGNDGSSRAPGDPIPLGSAVEVIGVPGFPYSEGDFSCDIGLGERMSVEIRQTLTC